MDLRVWWYGTSFPSMHVLFAFICVELRAATIAPAPLVISGGAYENCPCKTYPPTDAPRNTGKLLAETPADYGSGVCKAWDSRSPRFPQCSRANRPSWCEAKWCYVDEGTCNRTHFSSIFAWNATRYYSYATCGFVDTFSVQVPWEEEPTLPKIQVGVIFPGAEIRKEPAMSNPYNRIFYQFASEVMHDMQVDQSQIVYQELSNASKQAFPKSSYSACVNDIALGNIDFCIGGIWSTAERLALRDVAFVPVSSTSWVLVRPMEEESATFGEHLAAPFEPFSLGLWILLLGTLYVAGFAIALFEHGRLDDLDFCKRPCRSLLHLIFYMPINFFQGSLLHIPESLSGRIVAAGTTTFVVIVLANFTANITAFILTESLSNGIESIEDAVNKGHKLCYVASMEDQLLAKYPALSNPNLGIAVAGASENIPPSLAAGKCDVAVIDEYHFRIAQTQGDLCHFRAALKPVDYIFVGYYAAYWIAKATNYHVSHRRVDGSWYSLESRLLESTPICPNMVKETQGAIQLVSSDMYGICLVVPLSILAAGVAWLFKAAHKSQKAPDIHNNCKKFDCEGGSEPSCLEFDPEAREMLKQVHAMLTTVTSRHHVHSEERVASSIDL